ncbi:MAG: hypothetical protein Q7J07_06225 [Pelolinea sp.]|nr:hypothetical protein [Pelolinea sp.]
MKPVFLLNISASQDVDAYVERVLDYDLLNLCRRICLNIPNNEE